MARRKLTNYSNSIKLRVVEDYLSDKLSLKSLMSLHGIKNPGSVYHWLKLYEQYGIVYFSSKSPKMSKGSIPHRKSTTDKLASLKQENANLKLFIEYYRKVIEHSEKEFNIKIEKKSDTK